MIEDLASLSSIESEMSMTEMCEDYNSSEEKHPWVIALALLLEGIISQLVTIRLIVNLRVLFEGHSKGIA